MTPSQARLMLLPIMLSSRRFPAAPPSSTAPDRETKAIWSTTTATGEFDSIAAANDEVGMLSFHASACKLANGGLRRGIDALFVVGSVLRSRLISVVVVLTLAAAVAVWVFG